MTLNKVPTTVLLNKPSGVASSLAPVDLLSYRQLRIKAAWTKRASRDVEPNGTCRTTEGRQPGALMYRSLALSPFAIAVKVMFFSGGSGRIAVQGKATPYSRS